MAGDNLRMGDGFTMQLECAHEVTGAELKCKICGQTLRFEPKINEVGTSTVDWGFEYLKTHDV